MIADLDMPLPETMGQTFDTLANSGVINTELAVRLKKAVGYEAIDWRVVHSIACNHLEDFSAFARNVDSRLDD